MQTQWVTKHSAIVTNVTKYRLSGLCNGFEDAEDEPRWSTAMEDEPPVPGGARLARCGGCAAGHEEQRRLVAGTQA
jgi:hypothetical protein